MNDERSLRLEQMGEWVTEKLGLRAEVRVRPQNMAKDSHVVKYLRELGYIEADTCCAVLWAYVGNGTRFPNYLGAFVRNRDRLDPARIFRGSYKLAATGKNYSFYVLRKEGQQW